MKEKESHPIRNIVIGGLILAFALWLWGNVNVSVKLVLWLWGLVVVAWNCLWSGHVVYGWLIIVLVFLSAPTIISGIRWLIKKRDPNHIKLYRKDFLFEVTWHWNYVNGAIHNLCCFCPQCETELVSCEYIPSHYSSGDIGKSPKTEFKCERCNATKALFNEEYSHALGRVERQVKRKIKTDEWQTP